MEKENYLKMLNLRCDIKDFDKLVRTICIAVEEHEVKKEFLDDMITVLGEVLIDREYRYDELFPKKEKKPKRWII